MTNLTLRTVFVLFVAVAVSACSDDSPTSPSASSGTNLSALADGDSGQRQAAHHRPGHGGGPGGEDPPPPVYEYSATGDVTILTSEAGGKGGSVNLRATMGKPLTFSDGFIAQGGFDADGTMCFGDQTTLPPPVSSLSFDFSGILNPKTSVGDAAVQIYFTAFKDDGSTEVDYQLQGELQILNCNLGDPNLPCSFPPDPGQIVTLSWLDTARTSVERSGGRRNKAVKPCEGDNLAPIAGLVYVEGLLP